ncbi:MAG: thiamine phosphate synthase [Bacteroidales bacterium]|nr:thiamine phosphate synthase [Candidatus Physcousia equi]
MKLIILSTPKFFIEEDQIFKALFEEGLDLLHIRKPDSEPVLSERLLSLIPSEYHKRIVVHNHFYLKEEYNLRGIHLSRQEPEAPQDYSGKLSRTCYSLEELAEQRSKGKYDYLFLDSIFAGTSDNHRPSICSHEGIKDAARRGFIDRKVMASGGVNIDNIKAVADMGFGGVVVCGDLWNRFNIHRGIDYKELLTHFRRLRHAAE